MIKESHPVVQADVRPARPDGTCFYCRAPLGTEHFFGCVIRNRTVVVDVTLRLVRRVPEDWDAGSVEFHLNDSSWCASNIIDELKSVDTDSHCLCGQFSAVFVREATAKDEQDLGICGEAKP